jgi:hypothetical protein
MRNTTIGIGTTRKKRNKEVEEEDDHLAEVVDDLEIAYKYATVSSCFSVLALKNTTHENSFPNETKASTSIVHQRIVDYSSSSDDDDDDEDEDGASGTIASVNNGESSEDESDIDLTEALAQMDPDEILDEDEEDYDSKSNIRAKHGRKKTKQQQPNASYYYSNQIAASNQQEQRQQVDFMPKKDDVIELVGHIKSHIVSERVIVVESLSYSNMNKPLDEENVLLLSKTDTSQEVSNTDNDGGFVSLGKICEIFGPVSRPLYTIQLPSPICSNNPKSSNAKVILPDADLPKTSDPNEISTQSLEHDSYEEAVSSTNVSDTIEGCSHGNTEDPWSEGGKYTVRLQQQRQNNQRIPVYFERKRAVWVDTHAVIQQSGKGCDVNEEDVDEKVEFSDDEAEQRYYSNLKKKSAHKTKQQPPPPQHQQQPPHWMNNRKGYGVPPASRGLHTTTNYNHLTTNAAIGVYPLSSFQQHTASYGPSYPSFIRPQPQAPSISSDSTWHLETTTATGPSQLIAQPINLNFPLRQAKSATEDPEADTVYYTY